MSNPTVGAYTARRRRRAWAVVGAIAALALVAGVVFGPGFDRRDAEPLAMDVWVLQSTGSMYGSVSTSLNEINTVRGVAAADAVVQHGRDVLVFTDGLAAVTAIKPGYAADIEAGQGSATPSGTTDVVQAGDAVGYVTRSGAVFGGWVSDGTAVSPSVFDPYRDEVAKDGEEKHVFQATAVAVRPDGMIAGYSATEGLIMTAQIGSGELPKITNAPVGLEAAKVELAYSGEDLMIWDATAQQLWSTAWSGPVALESETGILQESMSSGGRAFVADEFGLLGIDIESQNVERLAGIAGESIGDPAAPTQVNGAVTGAWLMPSDGQGMLWIDGVGPSPLEYGGEALGDSVSPVIRDTGDAAVVNDVKSGWVWTLPAGTLVPSSQDWNPETPTVNSNTEEEVEPEVKEARPPVAIDDEFGVRAGSQVRLPVLLNDYDANNDVLTVVASSFENFDDTFGDLSIADDGQSLVINVNPDAAGSATFSYKVSDGVPGVSASKAATVRVKVHGDSVNSAPVWCGVKDCKAKWPTPTLVAGGSESIDVLSGWVDPDGDPIYVASAKATDQGLQAVASADGRVAVTHDAVAGTDPSVTATVEISDTRGESTKRPLVLPVSVGSKLAVRDLTVVVTTNQRHEIDITRAVTGSSGPVSVTNIVAPDGATTGIATGVTGVAFQAKKPGTYFVEYEVEDDPATETGLLRVDVIKPEDAKVSTVPLTAFVRAGEDVTVDVLKAATNPAAAVLTVEDVSIKSASGATATAEEIALSSIRITAGREDGGTGAVGQVKYTITDGLHRSATGQISVVLVDTKVAPPPAVADDSYTVRAGTQVDFPVLDNDTPAPGSVVALTAGSVSAEEGEGLAFTSGRLVRYLAPDQPGEYTFRYDAYAVGYPSQSARGKVKVTVVADGGNAAPTPSRIEARVNAGLKINIPIPTSRQDPDGDRTSVVEMGDMPSKGTAVITADGTAVEYTAPAKYSGQVRFTVVVTDPGEAKAEAEVVVAISATEAAAAPVAYTDTVQVQVGADSQVRVEPTSNDIDALGTGLKLVNLKPNAREGSSEYETMEKLIREVDTETNMVTLGASNEPTTFSFLYTVADEHGSTAIGRIVLKVVREDIPDRPIVADTVLGFSERDDFQVGIDVLDGKTSWATGDAAGLTVDEWAGEPNLAASGTVVSGSLPALTTLYAFEVVGTDFDGEEVTTYGFLTVPGERDYVPRLDSDAAAITVDEDSEKVANLGELIAVPDGKTLEIDASSVHSAGVRAEGACAAAGGTSIRYTAGKGSPFTDTCLVNAKLTDGEEWTLVTVPVTVIPVEPVPVLISLAQTVTPGSSATLNLQEAVTWAAGDRTHPVELVAGTYSGASFEVSTSGSTMTIKAHDTAKPGAVETMTLSAPAEADVEPATISLTVGPAPQTLPKGGSKVITCKQGSGNSCDIPLIPGNGEVNPFDSPLEVVSVSDAGDCPGVEITKASGSSARASWTDSAAGGVCDATFTAKDAQGRITTGDRVGTISVDFQGYPSAPAAVDQTAYGDGTVTLNVTPGNAASAYPALTGFVIKDGSRTVATCGASGDCGKITGLTNGEKRSYDAYAVNSIGESRKSVSVTAWSYAAPAKINPSQISFKPVPNGNDGNLINLTISVSDSDTESVNVDLGGSTTNVKVSGGTATMNRFNVGDNFGATITVTPVSRYQPPLGDEHNLGASTDETVHGIGAPTLKVQKDDDGSDDGSADLTITLGSGGTESTIRYGVSTSGKCDPSTEHAAGSFPEAVKVKVNDMNEVTVCASSWFDGQSFGLVSEERTIVPISVTEPDLSDFAWGVACSDGRCYSREATPRSGQIAKITNVAQGFSGVYFYSDGTESSDFLWSKVDANVGVTAKACKTIAAGRYCSDASGQARPQYLNSGSGQAFDFTPTCQLVEASAATDTDPATYLVSINKGGPPGGVTVSLYDSPRGWGDNPESVPFTDPGDATNDLTVKVEVVFASPFSGVSNQQFSTICTKP